MDHIAVRVPREDAALLRRLRTLGEIDVLEHDDAVWLRCLSASQDVVSAFHALHSADVFSVSALGEIVPFGKRLPVGQLPEGDWKFLSEWYRPELPTAGFAGRHKARIRVQLVRDERSPREPSLILANPVDWLAFGRLAPQIRLDRLQFAVSAAGEILIRGTPLPPIPGQHFYVQHGLAVPCGWRWDPEIDADVLAVAFRISKSQLLLWRDNAEPPELLEDRDFARATRAAIRCSVEKRTHA